MKNKLLIPLIVVSVVGLLTGASLGSVLIGKQVKYTKLTTDYDELTNDFENQLQMYEDMVTDYENQSSEMEQLLVTYQNLLDTYNILVSDNSNLQDIYNNLLTDYNLLVISYNLLYDSFIDLQSDYDDLQNNYDNLTVNFNILQIEYYELDVLFNSLQDYYDTLQFEYQELFADYCNLLDNYALLQAYADSLEQELSAFKNYIQTLILPLQYSVFAEAVRRYYMPIYLDGLSGKDFYMAYVEFCRDVILHDSWQENSFKTISNAFFDCLPHGSDTMFLAYNIMYYTFYDWLPSWGIHMGYDLSYIDYILQWCIDEIDYEYDTNITDGQYSPSWDYAKFPVETAFRTMGDCEDQAMLAAAYLESCGFETAFVISHDPAHPVRGPFYHGSLLVHIEDTTEYNNLYSAGLWSLGSLDPYTGSTWCWLDPTWDIPFGDIVPWVDEYGGSITSDVFSIAFCDIDGTVAQIDGTIGTSS